MFIYNYLLLSCMQKTTTELTKEYIQAHPSIKSCLKKGLINYSSLARLIAKDLKIEKKTSQEAILVAARRFKEKLKDEIPHEKKIRKLLHDSEIEIKNKINVFILERTIDFDVIQELQNIIRKENGTLFLLGGTNNYTLVTQEKYADFINKRMKSKVIEIHEDKALVKFISPIEIEYTLGVIAYLSSLFAEHEVNILEHISFWTDTLFVIDAKDVTKAMNFLNF